MKADSRACRDRGMEGQPRRGNSAVSRDRPKLSSSCAWGDKKGGGIRARPQAGWRQ